MNPHVTTEVLTQQLEMYTTALQMNGHPRPTELPLRVQWPGMQREQIRLIGAAVLPRLSGV